MKFAPCIIILCFMHSLYAAPLDNAGIDAGADDDQTIVIICSTDNPKESPHVIALEKFAELVAMYSNGRLAAKVHYRGNKLLPALRGEEINVDMLTAERKSGYPPYYDDIDMAVVAVGNVSRVAHVLDFLTLPYFFPDKAAAQQLFQSDFMVKEINQVLIDQHNIRALGWLIGGFRYLTNAKRPIERLDDVRGLVIRTPRNPLMQATYEYFGAYVREMSWEESYYALATGSVDGQENPYSVIAYSRFWDVGQKYITNNKTFLWTAPLLINNHFYESLPQDLQRIVDRAAAEAATYQWGWMERENERFIDLLKTHGMVFTALADEEEWVSRGKSLWSTNYRIIGYGNQQQGRATVEKALRAISADARQ